MRQETNSENDKSIKINKTFEDLKHNTSILPIHRCSSAGVHDFISREASSYSCESIDTIHNSVAKKAIDADLHTERKEIQDGAYIDKSEAGSSYEAYPSEVSFTKIRELLTNQINQWTFQTNNAKKLVTFYAKSSSKAKLEIFVNFRKDGDKSYILLGNNFGYIYPEVLAALRIKLCSVFSKISEETEKKELLEEFTDTSGITHKTERLKFEDPDYWFDLKDQALKEFMLGEESLLERILSYLNINSANSISMHNFFREEVLDDKIVTNYLLDSIKIDVKQIYA